MRRINLTNNQVNRVTEIFADLGIVAMASVTIHAVLDKFHPWYVILGLLAGFISWGVSIFLLKQLV
jgi:hypothetical protein